MKKIFAIAFFGLLALPAVAEVVPVTYYPDDPAAINMPQPQNSNIYYDDQGNPYYMDDFGNYYPANDIVPAEPVPPAGIAKSEEEAASIAATAPTPVARQAAPSARASVGRQNTRTAPASGARVISRTAVQQPSRATYTVSPRGIVTAAAPVSRTTGTYTTSTMTPAVTTVGAPSANMIGTGDRTVTARAGWVPGAGWMTGQTGQLLQGDTINKPLYIGGGNTLATTTATTEQAAVGVRPSSMQYMSRSPSITAGAGTTTAGAGTTQQAAPTGPTLEELTKAADFCRDQFFSCMDNFCNVLDENQGRCSCSGQITKFNEVEQALKNATDALQDVAQKIQYIGLTTDEINAIFTQTEAEAAMVGQRDTSQIKADLDKIRKMIVEVGGNSSTPTTNDFSMLFNVDFSFDNGFNLFDWLSGYNNSILSKRGADLYNSAVSKCRQSVLDSCQKQGIDTKVIASSYDMEIDKACVAYEKVLNDENDQMKRTVRNANNVLQKARLVIAQNKNIYDLRGCVNALDACMQDDFACGSDYEFCLDPTGKFIANGDVIVGSMPGIFDPTIGTAAGLFAIWNYSSTNAWANSGSLSDYIKTKISTTDNSNMVGFLQAKIGRNDGTRNTGMCMSVLNQCQRYTYTAAGGKFDPANDVIKQYLVRTLTTIKAKQDGMLADFAQGCISRVQSCLQTNNATFGYDGSDNKGSLPYSSYNACRALINTCASVNNDNIDKPGTMMGVNVIGAAICYGGAALPNLPPTNGIAYCPGSTGGTGGGGTNLNGCTAAGTTSNSACTSTIAGAALAYYLCVSDGAGGYRAGTSCSLVSCGSGYNPSGNSCVLSTNANGCTTDTMNSTLSCASTITGASAAYYVCVSNGTGGYKAGTNCNLLSCASGYNKSGNTCVAVGGTTVTTTAGTSATGGTYLPAMATSASQLTTCPAGQTCYTASVTIPSGGNSGAAPVGLTSASTGNVTCASGYYLPAGSYICVAQTGAAGGSFPPNQPSDQGGGGSCVLDCPADSGQFTDLTACACKSCSAVFGSGFTSSIWNSPGCYATSCPAHTDTMMMYSPSDLVVSPNGTSQGYATKGCKCQSGYVSCDGACATSCGGTGDTGGGDGTVSCPSGSSTAGSGPATDTAGCYCNSPDQSWQNGACTSVSSGVCGGGQGKGPGSVNQDPNNCSDCDYGYYNSGSSATCTKCPAGTTTNQTASWNGTYCSVTLPATGCPGKGWGNDGTGVRGCQKCGWHAVGDGTSACHDCAYNEVVNSDQTACVPMVCDAGTKPSQVSPGMCTQCEPGTWSPGGLDTCNKCPAGTYSTAWKATSISTCTFCSGGQIQQNAGQSSCHGCPLMLGSWGTAYLDPVACIGQPCTNNLLNADHCDDECPTRAFTTAHGGNAAADRAGTSTATGAPCYCLDVHLYFDGSMCQYCPPGSWTTGAGGATGVGTCKCIKAGDTYNGSSCPASAVAS